MELPERRRWGKCNELHAAFQSFGKVLISEGVQIGRWRFHVTCWAIKMLAMVTYSNWHLINHACFNEPNPHFLLKEAGVSVLIFWYLGEKFHLGIQWEIWSCRYPKRFRLQPQAGNFHSFEHEQNLSVDRGIFSSLKVGLEKFTNLREGWPKPQMVAVVELSGDPGASKPWSRNMDPFCKKQSFQHEILLSHSKIKVYSLSKALFLHSIYSISWQSISEPISEPLWFPWFQ